MDLSNIIKKSQLEVILIYIKKEAGVNSLPEEVWGKNDVLDTEDEREDIFF